MAKLGIDKVILRDFSKLEKPVQQRVVGISSRFRFVATVVAKTHGYGVGRVRRSDADMWRCAAQNRSEETD